MKKPIRFALSLLVCALAVPAAAQEIVYATPLPPATLAELAEFPEHDRPPREIRQRTFAFASTLGRLAGAAAPQPAAPAIAAPPVKTSFNSDTTKRLSPADASGAVGPNHVVGAFNNGLVVQDRGGKVLAQLRLEQFWAEPARQFAFYDPRLVYDAAADRWVVVSLDGVTTLMIGVSKTGDPAGEWRRYRLRLSDGGSKTIDFTRLAVTRDTIVVATHLWVSGATLVLSIAKTDLYGGAAELPARKFSFGGYVTPVHAPETAAEYLVVPSATNAVARLERGMWTPLKAPFQWETGESYAPQLGARLELDAGIGDIDHAVHRHGALYFVQTIRVNGRTAILWWMVNPDTGEVLDARTIQSATEHYAFPSLAVNRHGGMLIGFSIFSNSTYASSGYVYRNPKGAISAVAPLRRGDSAVTYSERWGDYTTTVTDPRDEDSFWTVQIHAASETWATAWGHVVVPPHTVRRRSVR